jgi:hypothetical protein
VEQPFVAVLEAARCAAVDSNAAFMQAYMQAESLEHALHDSELVHSMRLAQERGARLAAEGARQAAESARLTAEEGQRRAEATIAALQEQLARARQGSA